MRLDDAHFFAKRAESDHAALHAKIQQESTAVQSDMSMQSSRCRVHLFNMFRPLRYGDPIPGWAINRFDFGCDERELPKV